MQRGFGLAVIVLLAVVASAPGQGNDPDLDQIEEKIADVREKSVRVVFRLRNGSKVTGIVKNGRFIEATRDHLFVRANQLEGNGVRVWYADGGNGFIFLEWTQVKDIEILKSVSEADQKEIVDAAADRARRAIERSRQIDSETDAYFAELRRKKAEAELGKALVEAGQDIDEKVADYYRAIDLLEKFPPADGWGEEKYRRIYLAWRRDKDKNRIVPQGDEKEFYDSFELWKQAAAWKEQGLLDDLPPRAQAPSEPPEKPAAPPEKPAGDTGDAGA